MSVFYDEIFVGEKNRSVDILASSLSQSDSRMLAHFLDLPGQPPQGFILDTYVSGFAIKDYYVISRTSKDPRTKRPGIAFSHAFVFKKNAIEHLSDIRTIFRRLKRERPQQYNVSQQVANAETVETERLPPGTVCDMLTAKSGLAVVTADTKLYEELIIRIWFRLLPSMRSSFQFKLSFDPEEAARERLNFALVPPATLARWPQERRIGAEADHDSATAFTLAGQSLAASDNGKLVRFARELELERIEFSQLGLVGQACEKYRANDFSSLLTALRLVVSLQPDPSKGLIIKTPLAKSVIESPGPEKPEEILALRNLDWTPFSLTTTSPANLKNKFTGCFQVANEHEKKREIIESILKPDKATNEWQQIGAGSLANLTSQAAERLAVTAWSVLLDDKIVGKSLLEIIPSKVLDEPMAALDTVSTSGDQAAIRKLLAEYQYFHSEAMLLRKHHKKDNMATLIEACERDRDLFGDFAILNTLGRLSDENRIQAAIDIGDNILMNAAATYVAEKPLLLSSFNLHDKRIQTIWGNALSLSSNAWQIDKELTKTQDKILDTMKKTGVTQSVLLALMHTPVGNWIKYKDRPTIWNSLSGDSLNAALHKTAEGWIASLPDIVHEANFPLEAILAKAIAEPTHHESILTALRNCTFNDIITIFLSNNALSGQLFSDSLLSSFNSGKELTNTEAEYMGHLAIARKWESLTEELFAKHGANGNLRPYFKICASHLYIWDRIIYGLSSPSSSDIDSLLLETITELYPAGPKDRDIWEHAGGSPAHLDFSGTGQDQWRRALREIRLGSLTSRKKLLNRMLDEYPNNPKLQYLKEMV